MSVLHERQKCSQTLILKPVGRCEITTENGRKNQRQGHLKFLSLFDTRKILKMPCSFFRCNFAPADGLPYHCLGAFLTFMQNKHHFIPLTFLDEKETLDALPFFLRGPVSEISLTNIDLSGNGRASKVSCLSRKVRIMNWHQKCAISSDETFVSMSPKLAKNR